MKHLKLITILTITIVAGALPSCRHLGKGVEGSGVRKTEKRDLAAFTSIETTGAFDIQVTCQQSASFEIEGDDNILPLISTDVRGGVLRIYNSRSYNVTRAINVRISVPDLEKVSSTGAANIRLDKVKNTQLAISSTGAGKIEAAGETKLADIRSTGAGEIDAGKLRAERAKVSVTGAAHIGVYASQQLDVTVSGVGKVIYAGDPPVVNKSVSGFGEVKKKEAGGS